MITVLIYKLDFKEAPIATLKEGSHVFGRGNLLECDDRRVSRNHGVIEITNNSVTISSTHLNPCFFQTADSKTIIILNKNLPTNLNDGDKFALLADQFWYKVKIEKDNRDTDIIEGNSDTDIIEGNRDTDIIEVICESSTNETNDDVNTQKTKRSCEDDDSTEVKKTKLDNEKKSTGDSPPRMNTELSARDAELKAMLFSSDDEEVNDTASNDVIEDNENKVDGGNEAGGSKDNKKVDVSTDSKDSDNKAGTSGPNGKRPWRDYCVYGSECYRKNDAHFAEFSHPGDSDYESDSNDDRPVCVYGENCYRKNKSHRKTYKHPRGNSNQAAKKPQAPKNQLPKKPPARKNYEEESSEDDYDLDDPFMADSSSEFEPDSVSEDDTDSDANSGSEQEETKRLVKEARRFTKGDKKNRDDSS